MTMTLPSLLREVREAEGVPRHLPWLVERELTKRTHEYREVDENVPRAVKSKRSVTLHWQLTNDW
jgi:hypothetical protein